MVNYIIGVQQGNRSALDTLKDVQRALRNYGSAVQLVTPQKFRNASLDVLMFVNDKLAKLEATVENNTRKIERQYLDIK